MGGCGSKHDDHDEDDYHYKHQGSNGNPGVGMGVALMMQQAMMLGAAGANPAADLDHQVRRAKAEGRTVTIMNDCLYFDYQFVARVPPGMDLRV
uniref:Uncharacterized protein n=1 Tax=Plectus sambesii TaxID=2011161 RepID=A0A914WPI7_9BILA